MIMKVNDDIFNRWDTSNSDDLKKKCFAENIMGN